MSAEEEVKLRAGEESDIMQALEDEAVERSAAIVGSYLRKCHCVGCGGDALAVPEHVHDARCGGCMAKLTGWGGMVGGVVGPVQRMGIVPWTYTPTERWLQKNGVIPVSTIAWSSPEMARPGLVERPAYIPQRPEVSSREPWPAGLEVPSPVLLLAEQARELGWEVLTQYSRGVLGRTSKHMIGMRFGGCLLSENRAYATYVSPVSRVAWSWETVAVWGPELPPYLELSVTRLREWLTAGGVMPRSWYSGVSDHLAERKIAAKIVRCPGAPRCMLPGAEHTHRANGDVKPKRLSVKEKDHA